MKLSCLRLVYSRKQNHIKHVESHTLLYKTFYSSVNWQLSKSRPSG